MMNSDETAAAIRAALEHNPAIDMNRFPISVRVDDVVHLEGEVEDIIAKRKALRVARLVAGTARIEDRLRLATRERIASDKLRDAAVTALQQEPAFAAMNIGTGADKPAGQEQDWIRVAAQDCVLRLTGEVNSLSHRRLAEVIAWWVFGCCDVDNRLHVRPAEEESDAEIADAVRLVFDKDPALDAEQISVVARAREVTLRGAVRSEQQKRIATRDCWYIPGVHAVHNQLQVLPR
jgi:osmotically-inducible protein OsmY